MAIRKKAVMWVIGGKKSGRNLKCTINGIETISSYNYVLHELGWDPDIEPIP